ncbi:hypothetical protein N7540_000281 [Penicillium herquei]|nr:hypothetical protein N7540_000281 [Penicillium herquei]
MPDFGCYITVFNECSSPLSLSSQTIVDGNWKTPPPQTITNGQSYQFVLEDDLGPEGSEGFVTYSLEGTTASVVLHFSCPVWSSNIFTANSNNSVILNVTQVGPNSGHPLIGSATCTLSSFADPSDPSRALDPIPKEWNSTKSPDAVLFQKYSDYLTKLKATM